jgi:hypothetical protein
VASKVKIVIHEKALSEFVTQNKYIRDELVGVANLVAAEAKSTAQSAQNGPGGTIAGYAEAGFSVVWEARGGKRPRVNVVANADPNMSLRAYFYTMKRDGVDHLRAALYKFTKRG